tara:strand:- start:21465 stop:21848 length:384 start_codon:yes stop_codon:yes gene_type:complete
MNDLNEDNFLLYAMKSYDKPNAILSEFEDDLHRVKYIKRLFKRYRTTGELKERLILNHIIILTNVFGILPSVRILFYKLDETDYVMLKTFLLFLNFMPDTVPGIKGKDYSNKDITVDLFVGKRLRSI